MVSSLGETTITRRYYHCANCKEGIFPLDESLGLMAHHPWSPRLQRLTSKLVARLPYAEGEITRDLHQVATRSSDPERAAALERAATYFSHNRDRMQHQELREQGWPIGSGVVESAAKQFKARVTGPGMRWSRAGAEHMLTLRAAVLSGSERFDALWSRAYENLPPS